MKMVGVCVASFFAAGAMLWLLAAAPSLAAPQLQGVIHQVYITDVRDVQFAVSWMTDGPSDGQVEWGISTTLGLTASDGVSTTTHYVVVGGLSPDTTYYFQVRSGGGADNNNGDYYSVTTGAVLELPLVGDFVYGYAYEPDGLTPVANAVVYLEIQDNDGSGSSGDSQWATARTDAAGAWYFSNLSNVRTADASGYFAFAGRGDDVRVLVQGGDKGVGEMTVVAPTVYPARLPDVTLNGVPTAVEVTRLVLAQSTVPFFLVAAAVMVGVIGLFSWRRVARRWRWLWAVGIVALLLSAAAGVGAGAGADVERVEVILGASLTRRQDIGLEPGWNLIALPLRPTITMTAQALLDQAAAQGGDCSQVNRWSGVWEAHFDGSSSNNFSIELGKGYFVKCSQASVWRVTGEVIAAPVALDLSQGWNLVALPYGPYPDRAQAWLDDISSQGGAASAVYRWLNGGWDGHWNGLAFNDFGIANTAGYFVKAGHAAGYMPPLPDLIISGLSMSPSTSVRVGQV